MNIKSNLEAIIEITGKDPVYYFNYKEVHTKWRLSNQICQCILRRLFLPSAFYYSQKTKISSLYGSVEPGNYCIAPTQQ
jgi:hypothetical protein